MSKSRPKAVLSRPTAVLSRAGAGPGPPSAAGQKGFEHDGQPSVGGRVGSG